jgi:hypothetical protein
MLASTASPRGGSHSVGSPTAPLRHRLPAHPARRFARHSVGSPTAPLRRTSCGVVGLCGCRHSVGSPTAPLRPAVFLPGAPRLPCHSVGSPTAPLRRDPVCQSADRIRVTPSVHRRLHCGSDDGTSRRRCSVRSLRRFADGSITGSTRRQAPRHRSQRQSHTASRDRGVPVRRASSAAGQVTAR